MLGWLGLTVGKPRGRSLCVWGVASGSAASHPDLGSSGMVEFSEESRKMSRQFRIARSIAVENANDAGEAACNKPEA